VTLCNLRGLIAPGAVDPRAALYCRALGNFFGPALHVGVFLDGEELRRVIQVAAHQLAVPGPYGDVGDTVLVTAQIRAFGQAPLKDIQLALGLHGEAVDGVLDLLRRIHIEVAEAAAQVGCCAHLPEQPVECLGSCG